MSYSETFILELCVINRFKGKGGKETESRKAGGSPPFPMPLLVINVRDCYRCASVHLCYNRRVCAVIHPPLSSPVCNQETCCICNSRGGILEGVFLRVPRPVLLFCRIQSANAIQDDRGPSLEPPWHVAPSSLPHLLWHLSRKTFTRDVFPTSFLACDMCDIVP